MRTNKITFRTSTEFTAPGTGLAGMIRANLNNINTFFISLVGDEAMQLIETPSIEPEIESLSFPGLPYAFEIFQYNSSSIAIADNLFAYHMVPVSLETSLPARNLFQEFLSASSAFALEPCSQSFEFDPFRLNIPAAEELPVACYSDVVYSDINTQLKPVRSFVDVDFFGKSNVEKHPALFVDGKQSSLTAPVKIFPIILRNFNRNINPALDCCKPDFIKAKSKCSFVKSQRHKFLKNRLRSFVSLDRFKGLRSYPIGVYDKLRRQVKHFPGFVITKMVEFVSVMNICFKAFIGNIRNCFGVSLHSINKQFIFRNFQLDCCSSFHNQNCRVPYLYTLRAHMSCACAYFQYGKELIIGDFRC